MPAYFTFQTWYVGIAHAVFATRLGGLRASLNFLEDSDYLFFGELRLLHAELLLGETLLLDGLNYRGHYNERFQSR